MTALARSSDLAGSNLVVASNYAYDAANRLTTITHQNSAAAVLSSFGYTLDAAGRLTAEARTSSAPADNLAYSYTNNDQLTAVTHSNGTATQTFGYDPNGNRNTSGYATAASNQATSDGTYNYAYDAQGNLISKTAIAGGNATTYAWDNRDRLTSVVQVVGGTTTTSQYTYDAMNRLIKVAVNGATTRATLYDGQTPLLDFNASGAVAARYLSVPGAIDELLARQTSSGVAWYLDDREGTVRDIVNNSGTSIDHIDYGAFGNLTAQSTPANGDRFQYAGMEADANTGLNYDRARWYDPKGGKFVGQDPIGFAGGDSNVYRYVGNSPANGFDPSGLDFWGTVGGVVEGGFAGAGSAGLLGVGFGSFGGPGGAIIGGIGGLILGGIGGAIAGGRAGSSQEGFGNGTVAAQGPGFGIGIEIGGVVGPVASSMGPLPGGMMGGRSPQPIGGRPGGPPNMRTPSTTCPTPQSPPNCFVADTLVLEEAVTQDATISDGMVSTEAREESLEEEATFSLRIGVGAVCIAVGLAIGIRRADSAFRHSNRREAELIDSALEEGFDAIPTRRPKGRRRTWDSGRTPSFHSYTPDSANA